MYEDTACYEFIQRHFVKFLLKNSKYNCNTVTISYAEI